MNFLFGSLLVAIAASYTTAVPIDRDVSLTKDTLKQKYPELVQWFDRAALRIRNNATASPEDLNNVRGVMEDGKQKVVEFVNSPLYKFFADMVIDKSVSVASPFLGVMPFKEFKEFMRIVNEKPELVKLVFSESGEGENFVKLLPNAALFDQWLMNNAKKVVDDIVKSASLSEVGSSIEDFDILRSDDKIAPVQQSLKSPA